MKKIIPDKLALYPTPVTVVGVMANGKPNWLIISHIGILGHDHIMLSCSKAHYSHQFIEKQKIVSVNIVDRDLLSKADYVATVSGEKIDKSQVFAYDLTENNVPIIKASPLSLECELEGTYETKGFTSFVFTLKNTYADENILTDKNKVDYHKLKPVLFEMQMYQYLSTGDIIGKCRQMH